MTNPQVWSIESRELNQTVLPRARHYSVSSYSSMLLRATLSSRIFRVGELAANPFGGYLRPDPAQQVAADRAVVQVCSLLHGDFGIELKIVSSIADVSRRVSSASA